MAQFSQPRDLKTHERALLEFLLTAGFPGRDELKDQMNRVKATGECDCGCGTIYFTVKEPSEQEGVRAHPCVEAHAEALDVILFVRGGLLSSLEIVDYLNRRPLTYPSPADLKLWVRPESK